jgi:hypothetical protein
MLAACRVRTCKSHPHHRICRAIDLTPQPPWLRHPLLSLLRHVVHAHVCQCSLYQAAHTLPVTSHLASKTDLPPGHGVVLQRAVLCCSRGDHSHAAMCHAVCTHGCHRDTQTGLTLTVCARAHAQMLVMLAQAQTQVQAPAQAPVQALVPSHTDGQPIRDQTPPTDPPLAACATTDLQGDRTISEAPAAQLTSRLVAQLVASVADWASGALAVTAHAIALSSAGRGRADHHDCLACGGHERAARWQPGADSAQPLPRLPQLLTHRNRSG